MVTKQELKQMFRTGEIPTGQSFAAFIDAFVSYVDGKIPDATGNVNTDFKVIPILSPTVGPTGYPEGTSEFFTDYDKAQFAAFIADNPNFGVLESGHLLIRTFRPKIGREIVQHVYNLEDGEYSKSFVRVGDLFDDVWGDLKPISTGGSASPVEVVDHLESTSSSRALSANQGRLLHGYVENAQQAVNGLEDDLINHDGTVGDEDNYGHVKVDGVTIVSDDGVISAVGGGGGSVTVVDDLNTQSSTSALSARQGYQLKAYAESIDNMVDTVNDWIDVHEFDYATDETLGHVRYDDDSIKAYHGLLEVDTQDSFTSTSRKKPLSAFKGKELKDALDGLGNVIDQHANTYAGTLQEGHVKVDGDTIVIDQNGVISANSPVQTATTSRFGIVKPDGISLAINESGSLYRPQIAGMLFRFAVVTMQTGHMIPWDYYQYTKHIEVGFPPITYVQLRANRFYRLTAQLGVDRTSTGYADFQFARFNGTEGLGQGLPFLTSGSLANTRVHFENSYSGIFETQVQLDIIYCPTEDMRVGVKYMGGTGDIRVLPNKSRFLFQEL